MTDSNATYNFSVNADNPDYASGDIVFIVGAFFVSGNSEVFPGTSYTLTLDGSGQGTQVLPSPDNDGTTAVNWNIVLPSGEVVTAALSWSATTQELSDILASASTTTDPDDITAALANKVSKSGDTMTGILTLSAAPTADLHAATKKYVDDNAGGGGGGDFLADGSVPMTGTLELDPGADDAAEVLTIPITSTDGADFNINVNAVDFSGTIDNIFNYGFNAGPGGPKDLAKHAWYMQAEYNYLELGTNYAEWHLNIFAPGGSPDVRPVQFKYNIDATEGSVVFVASDFSVFGIAGSNALLFSNIGTASQRVVLTAAEAFIKVKNVAEAFKIENTDLGFSPMTVVQREIQFRADNHQFYSVGGTLALRVTTTGIPSTSFVSNLGVFMPSTGDGLKVTGSVGMTSPSRLMALNNSSNALQFGIDPAGHVMTNQTSAGTTLGAVVAKVPIYNASNTLVGYMPIYDAIT